MAFDLLRRGLAPLLVLTVVVVLSVATCGAPWAACAVERRAAREASCAGDVACIERPHVDDDGDGDADCCCFESELVLLSAPLVFAAILAWAVAFVFALAGAIETVVVAVVDLVRRRRGP